MRLFAFLLLTVPAAAQSYPAVWNLAQPDTKALIGINVSSLKESSVAKSYAADVQKNSVGMLSFPGLELLSDIEQVFISSPGAKTANPKENPPVLIVLSGHFTREHLRMMLKGTHRPYHSVDIYPPSGAGNVSTAILDERTVLLGDTASLMGAIDRRGQTTRNLNPILARAAARAANDDIWVIATVPPSALQPTNMTIGAEILSSIRGVDFGLSLRDGFKLNMSLETKSVEDAHQLAQKLSSQIQAAMLTKMDARQAADLGSKLQVSSAGNQLTMKLALSKEELEAQIRAAQAAGQSGLTQAEPVDDGRPKSIKIYGLEEGVREIPFPKPPIKK